MKNLKKMIFGTAILLFAVVFMGCNLGNDTPKYPEFKVTESYNHAKESPSANWNVKNDDGEYIWYLYKVSAVPSKYKDCKDAPIFYRMNNGTLGNMWSKSRLTEIENALQTGKFKTFEIQSHKCIELTEVKDN